MKIAVVGESMIDVEVSSGGHWNGTCPENHKIPLFKGAKVNIFAGGAANTATILTQAGHTVTLYTQGPGQKEKQWLGELFKKVVRSSKIVYSNEGSFPLKVRGLQENEVACRIDAEEITPHNNGFPALLSLADECDRFDAVIISDYCKGLICDATEDVIRKIIKKSMITVVDSKRRDFSLWRGCTAVTPNADEAAAIYSTTNPRELVDTVGSLCCYITRSEKSILYADSKDCGEIELLENIEHPYVAGAGDAFASGVAIGLAERLSCAKAGYNAMLFAQKYVKKGRKSMLR